MKADNQTFIKAIKYGTYLLTAIFFVGTWTGAWIRIKKTLRQEKSYDNTESRLEFLTNKLEDQTSKLEEKTNRILGHLTGGESFCYYVVEEIECDEVTLEPVFEGEYPLTNLTCSIAKGLLEDSEIVTIDQLNEYNTFNHRRTRKLEWKTENETTLVMGFFHLQKQWLQLSSFTKEEGKIKVNTIVIARLFDDVRLHEDSYFPRIIK